MVPLREGGAAALGAGDADERVQALMLELEQVSTELRFLRSEHQNLMEQHAQVKQIHQAVLEQRAELAQEVAGLQAEVDRLADECKLHEQRYQQAEAEIRELSKALLVAAGAPQRAIAQTAALEAQIEQWKQAYAALEAECERLRAALARQGGAAG